MEKVIAYLKTGEGYEKNKEAKHLNDIDSKTDPENDPFRSKFLARNKWSEIVDYLNTFYDLCSCDTLFISIICALNLNIASNYIDTDEYPKGEIILKEILSSLDGKCDENNYSVLHGALNHLGFLCTTRENPESGLKYLDDAEVTYQNYRKSFQTAPLRIDDILFISNDTENLENIQYEEMEELYTLTLYYKAQAFSNIGERGASAFYCNLTLKRQLQSMKYDAVDWALNTATLSQYYISVQDFNMARHCLTSAVYIFGESEEKNATSDANEKESNNRKKADIERCWIKYGLVLLENSQEHLLNTDYMNSAFNSNKSDINSFNVALEHYKSQTSHEMDSLQKDLKFDLYLAREQSISDKYALDFQDARNIFLVIQESVKSAKEFYTLNEHCYDFINITEDYSLAFRLLKFFETDLDRQYKMDKRRVDMLKSLLDELNPQFYMQSCKRISYELAEIYSSLADLKLSIVKDTGEQSTRQSLNKINVLLKSSIKFYHMYLDWIKEGKPDNIIKFNESDVKCCLLAYFFIGRLYGKLLTTDKNEKIENIDKSLEMYNFVIKYCERYDSAECLIATEYKVCKEMSTLLPVKKQRLLTSSEDI